MSESGANVKVYQGSVLVKEYNVPLNQAGYIWNVFKIENGNVVDINNYNADETTMYGEYASLKPEIESNSSISLGKNSRGDAAGFSL